MDNHAHSTPTPTPTPDATTPPRTGPVPPIISYTVGANHSGPYAQFDTPWDHPTEDALAHRLRFHPVGPKAGDCLMPAIFNPINGRISRRQECATSIALLLLDFDKGHAFEEIKARLVEKGVAAAIVTTHSHMTTKSDCAASAWENWKAANPDGSAEDFLLAQDKHLPAIVQGAEFVGVEECTNRYGKQERRAFFKHNPCPKVRVVIPFTHPWVPPAGLTVGQATEAYRAKYEDMVRYLGFEGMCDLAVAGTQSLIYFPRHAEGAPFESVILEGKALNPDVFVTLAFDAPTPKPAKDPSSSISHTSGGSADPEPVCLERLRGLLRQTVACGFLRAS
jgi:hypothetical protein